MKLWIKAAAVFSVFMLLVFGYNMYKVKHTVYCAEESYTQQLQIPTPLTSKDIELSSLIENIPLDSTPFRQKFFEVIDFKGIMRSKSGDWVSLFGNPNGGILKLGMDETFDGVTITHLNNCSCAVRFGNSERSFKIYPEPKQENLKGFSK